AAASESGVQLRFEASVCAAIPVIKVLRESLVVTNVHSVLGIVNGTTNFILSQMEQGADYADALAEAQRLGFAEADPTEDVTGADAAAKMAILATVAFRSRTTLDDVEFDGIERVTQEHVRAARELEMTVRPGGSRTASCVPRSTSASRWTTSPACSRRSRCGSPATRSRSPGSSSTRTTGGRPCTWSHTRRERARWRRRWRRSPACRRHARPRRRCR